ncbi:Cysteine protease atg4 [Tieghemiomyces parasiticus]|uniref:Cysteine protease n=1 Tax=Tieghemiomyces parasiticus TaxID=78921 RepID=A0A9W7ZZG1_9FUNG|nr:Cysteine protease atg4 [Tieghemiomyces parasiticus]
MEQTYRQILKLVADYPGDEYALSVHRMGQRGQDLDVAVGQWFGPHLACHVIRDLINESRPFDLRVFLATDGVVYQDKLFTECRATAEDGNDNDDGEMLGPTLILVSTRLGIHQVNPVYYPFVKYCFSLPHFVGIAGGKPASAAYFVGFEDNDLIFLDPHYTRPAAGLDPADGLPHSADLPSYHCVAPNKVALSRVDPCMLLGFYVRNTAEFADLKVRLAELAHQQKDAPIVTIAERTPAYLTSEGFSDHEEEAEDSGSESGMGSRGIISKVNGEGTATITTDSVMTARVPAADAEADESAYEYISHWSVASTRPSLHRQPVSPTSSPPSLVRYPTGSRSAPSGDDDLVDITEAQATEPPVPIDMANLEDDAEVHNHGVVSQSESESEASPSNTLAAPAAVADDTAGFLLVNRTPRNQRKAVPDCRYRVQK